MPRWGNLFETRRGADTVTRQSVREYAPRGASGVARLSTTPMEALAHAEQPPPYEDVSPDDEASLIDDGPLHKLTAAYHRSLENGTDPASLHTVPGGWQSGRRAQAVASGRHLVVRERQSDGASAAHTLHASESHCTSGQASDSLANGSGTAGSIAMSEAPYDLGLDADEAGEMHALMDATTSGWEFREEVRGFFQDKNDTPGKRQGKPWMRLKAVAKACDDNRRHILSPRDDGRSGGGGGGDAVSSSSYTDLHTSSRGSLLASLQGPSLSLHPSGLHSMDGDDIANASDDDDDDDTQSAFRDALDLSDGGVLGSDGRISPSGSCLSAWQQGARLARGTLRRVNVSVNSTAGFGSDDDGAAMYGMDGVDGSEVAAEVAVLRLDDEFYTSSELAQWRRLQSERVGPGLVSTTPATLATNSDGSFPSSLCTRTATRTSSTSTGDAVLVMRSGSDASNTAPTSNLSDGIVPVRQSHIRHVLPVTRGGGESGHAASLRNQLTRTTPPRLAPPGATPPSPPASALPMLTTPSTLAATATRTRTSSGVGGTGIASSSGCWGGQAKMENTKTIGSQVSETGLSATPPSCITTNQPTTTTTAVAAHSPPQREPPQQRRLSRPTAAQSGKNSV